MSGGAYLTGGSNTETAGFYGAGSRLARRAISFRSSLISHRLD
jgi:hypothetical protein